MHSQTAPAQLAALPALLERNTDATASGDAACVDSGNATGDSFMYPVNALLAASLREQVREWRKPDELFDMVRSGTSGLGNGESVRIVKRLRLSTILEWAPFLPLRRQTSWGSANTTTTTNNNGRRRDCVVNSLNSVDGAESQRGLLLCGVQQE